MGIDFWHEKRRFPAGKCYFRMWFKNGLKTHKLQKQYALKGQKLLAQGIALGIMAICKAPCKGKSFMSCLEF